jgi:hypothetical protein
VCRKGIKNDVREDKLYLSDKGTFEQRFEWNKGVSQTAIWLNNVLGS